MLSQILAEELGLPLEQVAIVASDTGVTPVRAHDRREPHDRARRPLLAAMAACADRQARAVAEPGGRAAWASRTRSRRFFGAGGEIIGVGAVRRHGEFQAMPPFWEIGASGVVASVDAETGRVRIQQLTTVGDVGFAINPALVHGQDLGAATMGLGAALSEQLVYDGQTLANPNVVDYRVPRCSDPPERLDQILAERRDGIGPYGAKGAGEGALNPLGAAVAAAVGRLLGPLSARAPAHARAGVAADERPTRRGLTGR